MRYKALFPFPLTNSPQSNKNALKRLKTALNRIIYNNVRIHVRTSYIIGQINVIKKYKKKYLQNLELKFKEHIFETELRINNLH